MRPFTSDCLVYVYKTYKVIKLYWQVSFYNNISYNYTYIN